MVIHSLVSEHPSTPCTRSPRVFCVTRTCQIYSQVTKQQGQGRHSDPGERVPRAQARNSCAATPLLAQVLLFSNVLCGFQMAALPLWAFFSLFAKRGGGGGGSERNGLQSPFPLLMHQPRGPALVKDEVTEAESLQGREMGGSQANK